MSYKTFKTYTFNKSLCMNSSKKYIDLNLYDGNDFADRLLTILEHLQYTDIDNKISAELYTLYDEYITSIPKFTFKNDNEQQTVDDNSEEQQQLSINNNEEKQTQNDEKEQQLSVNNNEEEQFYFKCPCGLYTNIEILRKCYNGKHSCCPRCQVCSLCKSKTYPEYNLTYVNTEDIHISIQVEDETTNLVLCECPICLTYSNKEQMITCPNDHIICYVCRNRIKNRKCPFCRSQYAYSSANAFHDSVVYDII